MTIRKNAKPSDFYGSVLILYQTDSTLLLQATITLCVCLISANHSHHNMLLMWTRSLDFSLHPPRRRNSLKYGNHFFFFRSKYKKWGLTIYVAAVPLKPPQPACKCTLRSISAAVFLARGATVHQTLKWLSLGTRREHCGPGFIRHALS